MPNCKSNEFGMCRYEDFRSLYDAKIKQCDLSNICSVKDEL